MRFSIHVVLAIVCGFLLGCNSETAKNLPTPPANSPPSQNSSAPASATAATSEITLKPVTVEGYKEFIAQQRGKVVVVDFWATWCTPCVKQFPHTIAWARQYSDKGLVAASMSFDEPDDQAPVLEFLKKQNALIPNLISTIGPGPEQVTAYEITGGAIPHYKVYDRHGKLQKTYEGNPLEQGIEELLEKLLAEKGP